MRATATKVKEKFFEMIQTSIENREEIIITLKGEDVVKIVPIKKKSKSGFGKLKGKLKIQGDLTKPIDDDWTLP